MTDDLPGPARPRPTAQVQPYVDALGIEDAIRFLLAFGAQSFTSPPTPGAGGRSKRCSAPTRPDKARALAAEAHRLPARVPLAKPWLARCLAARGESAATIARTLRTTDVTVRKWLG